MSADSLKRAGARSGEFVVSDSGVRRSRGIPGALEEKESLDRARQDRVREKFDTFKASPDLPAARKAALEFVRSNPTPVEALTRLTPILQRYHPLLVFRAIKGYKTTDEGEKSALKALEAQLLKANTELMESEDAPLLNLETLVTPKDRMDRLKSYLDLLVKIPFAKREYFSTIDFLEDVVGTFNKYDPEMVKTVVKEFVKDSKYNSDACETLMSLAHLPRAERDDFLLQRRKHLKLDDVVAHHGAENNTEKRVESEEGLSGEKTIVDTVPLFPESSTMSPLPGAKELSARRVSAELAKKIEAAYGHPPEVLAQNPSLATPSKDAKPAFGQRVLGFFRQMVGRPVNSELTKLLDEWGIAKMEEDAFDVKKEASQKASPGNLARRSSPLESGVNLVGSTSRRRGALQTLGSYEQKDVDTVSPEVLLDPAYELLRLADKDLKEAEAKPGRLTEASLDKLRASIQEAYYQVDERRLALEGTPQLARALDRVDEAYSRHRALVKVLETNKQTLEAKRLAGERQTYAGTMKEVGVFEPRDTRPISPEMALAPVFEVVRALNGRLEGLKKKKIERVTLAELTTLKKDIDEAYYQLDDKRIALEGTPQFDNLLNQISWVYHKRDELVKAKKGI